MSTFNPSDYQGRNVVFLCDEENDAIELFEILRQNEYVWRGMSDLTETQWAKHKDKTCYLLHLSDKSIQYGDFDTCREMEFEIIRWKDICPPEPIALPEDEWDNIISQAKGGEE